MEGISLGQFQWGQTRIPPMPLAWGAVCPPAPTMTPPLARISPLSTRNRYLPHWHKWKCVAPPLSTLRPFEVIFSQVLLRINFIKALAIVTSYNAVAWQPAETCLRSAGVVSTALRQQICVWVVSTALPRIPIAVSDVRDAVYFGSCLLS